MRPLEESEIQQVFEKLFKFVGKNLKNIVDRADQPHCFRLHKKVRRDSRSAPRSRPASLFPRWGKSTLMLCAPWSHSVSAMMKEISALLIPREVHQILMVEFLRLSRRDRGRGPARLPTRSRLVASPAAPLTRLSPSLLFPRRRSACTTSERTS